MQDLPSPLPVDIERFEQITDGDKDILRELCGEYFSQAENIIESIKEAIDIHSMPEIRQLAHKLRGSSATCGIVVVVSPLGILEHLPKDSDFDVAMELHGQIKKGLNEARAFLNSYLA